MRSLFCFVAAFITGSLLIAAGSFAADNAAADPGSKAPSFTLKDEVGRSVSLDDYKGKVVVLEWINPECPFVQRHYKAKTMSTLADKFAGQGVVWLAIDSSKSNTPEKSAQWKSQHGLKYPILQDPTGAVGRAYSAKTTPQMFVINDQGVIVYNGAIDDDRSGSKPSPTNYVANALEQTLGGKAVSTPQTKPYGCSVKYAE